MIYRLLRRLTVRRRLIFGFGAVLLMMIIGLPLIISVSASLIARLQQLTEVDVKIDRLLLQSSRQVLSARVNLQRYVDDLVPSPAEALKNLSNARTYLEEAQRLVYREEDKAAITQILASLQNYDGVVRQVQTARTRNLQSEIPDLVFRLAFLGGDIDLQIGKVLDRSEQNVAEANQSVLAGARNRFLGFVGLFVLILLVALAVGLALERTMTRPLAAIQAGAEQFRLRREPTSIPEDGNDELSHFAHSFNLLTAELSGLYRDLENQVYERTQALDLTYKVSTRLSTILDPGNLLIAVVEEVQSAFNFYHVHIYLYDETGQNLKMMGGTGEAGKQMLASGHSIPGGKGLVGRAAVTNSAVLVSDTTSDPSWLPNPLLPETKAEVAVPISIGERVLGVLDVQQNVTGGLTEKDAGLLTSIANQVAVAVQNARVYTQVQQQAERETLINTLGRKIQGARTIDDVLKVAVQELWHSMGAQQASIEISAPLVKENETRTGG